jgi:hypothetical protein
MEKKVNMRFLKKICCGFCYCIQVLLYAQEVSLLKGTVVFENTQRPLEGVLLRLGGTPVFTHSNPKGFFELETTVQGLWMLEISAKNFVSKTLPLELVQGVVVDLGVLSLSALPFEEIQRPTVLLSQAELFEEENGGADNIPGLMQASKDVFLNAAAFRFGQARFKVRGYDSQEGLILINGIEMNKHFDGRPQWSNWGGLNAVLRNQELAFGIAASEHSFGGLAGVTHFSTRASQYRPGNAVSVAATRGSYRSRVLASYATGLLENGWALTLSASLRAAENGVIDGTHYWAWSSFIALEKQLHPKHSLNLTAFVASNKRAKSSPNTQEVLDLRGAKYNAYWGLQSGKVRNARIREIREPIFQLTHTWKVQKNTEVGTTVSFQKGHVGNSRLGNFKAPNSSPTYYQKLPSYSLRFPENPNYENAYLSLREFQNYGQIAWKDLFQANALNPSAKYFLYEDRNEDQTWTFHSKIDLQFSRKWRANIGFSFQDLYSLNYAKMRDLLGAATFVDLDPYATGVASQNDLNRPDRNVEEGDSFSYRYALRSKKAFLFFQSHYHSRRLEIQASWTYRTSLYQRDGGYRNGSYPDNSYGRSPKKTFRNFSGKANLLYKLTGRHLFGFNLGLLSQAPTAKSVFPQVRVTADFAPELRSELRQTVDLSYRYRAPGIQARLTGYHTQFSQGTSTSFSFAQGLRGEEADFVALVLTGIEKQHQGVEFGMEAKLNSSFQLSAVAALGSHVYANNPHLYLRSDQFVGEKGDFGSAYLKSARLGGSPQRAYSLGIEYRDPAYWWAQVNANFLSHRYLNSSPLIRTANFFLDADGIPFVNPESSLPITAKEVKDFWQQERLKDLFLVNFVGGKSWKTPTYYLSLFASVTNLLGTVFKTGGFEQSRKANFRELSEDMGLETPLFGPKYWTAPGVGYYLMLSVYF